jgi:hypothetical protein
MLKKQKFFFLTGKVAKIYNLAERCNFLQKSFSPLSANKICVTYVFTCILRSNKKVVIVEIQIFFVPFVTKEVFYPFNFLYLVSIMSTIEKTGTTSHSLILSFPRGNLFHPMEGKVGNGLSLFSVPTAASSFGLRFFT